MKKRGGGSAPEVKKANTAYRCSLPPPATSNPRQQLRRRLHLPVCHCSFEPRPASVRHLPSQGVLPTHQAAPSQRFLSMRALTTLRSPVRFLPHHRSLSERGRCLSASANPPLSTRTHRRYAYLQPRTAAPRTAPRTAAPAQRQPPCSAGQNSSSRRSKLDDEGNEQVAPRS